MQLYRHSLIHFGNRGVWISEGPLYNIPVSPNIQMFVFIILQWGQILICLCFCFSDNVATDCFHGCFVVHYYFTVRPKIDMFLFQWQCSDRLFPRLLCCHVHTVCVYKLSVATWTDSPWGRAGLVGARESYWQSCTGEFWIISRDLPSYTKGSENSLFNF